MVVATRDVCDSSYLANDVFWSRYSRDEMSSSRERDS